MSILDREALHERQNEAEERREASWLQWERFHEHTFGPCVYTAWCSNEAVTIGPDGPACATCLEVGQ